MKIIRDGKPYLTERQREIIEYIHWFITKNGYSPSMREIALYFGFSVKGTYDHLLVIKRKGYISMTPRTSRSIVLNCRLVKEY